jgi:RNA polymerase sigma factor (sigma-70 family)
MSDDAALLRRYADERAEDAFTELVHRHVNLVYAVALRRTGGDTHLAADITQCVFTALARRASTLSPHIVLTGWLYTTTRHIAIDAVRAGQRRQVREWEAHAMQEQNSSSTPEADWEQLRPLLDDAMDDMPVRDREAVLLRFYEDRPFREIGTVLNLTEGAARMRVERALEKLRALLARRGIASTSAALSVALASHAVGAAPAGLAMTVTGAAITASTTATVGALNFLGFMSTTKFAGGIAAFALIVTLGVAIRETRASREIAASLAAATDDYQAHARILRELQQRTVAAERSQSELQQAIAAAEAAKTEADRRAASEAAAFRMPTNQEMLAAGNEFLRTNPEVRHMLVDYTRLRSRYDFAPLMQSLRLTPQQIEAVVDAAEFGGGLYFGNAANDFAITLSLSGEAGESPRRQAESRVRAVLGEEAFRQYEELKRIRPATQTVAELAGNLYWSDAPLTAPQAEQLTKLLAGSSGEFANGRPVEAAKLDWNQVTSGARTILADAQFSALQDLRRQTAYHQAMGRAQSEARRQQAAAAAAPAGKNKP